MRSAARLNEGRIIVAHAGTEQTVTLARRPMSDAQQVHEGGANPEPPPRRHLRRWRVVILGSVIGILLLNLGIATLPTALTLSQDDRNDSITLVARFGYYLDPTTLTLDLWAASEASTADLTRALFQVAASRSEWPRVRYVTLSRRNWPVYILSGDDFAEIGRLFEAGENPVYLMRTLPERLYLPSGEPAFERWEGGLLGVLGEQLEDLNEFGKAWALGGE